MVLGGPVDECPQRRLRRRPVDRAVHDVQGLRDPRRGELETEGASTDRHRRDQAASPPRTTTPQPVVDEPLERATASS